MEELAHRLKNQLATIQSIIAVRLRDHPEISDKISRSLAALMAADDLIAAGQGQGSHIRDILSAELSPYGLSRVSMNGQQNVLLPEKLALMFALLVHELATNAAKYGSLAQPTGELMIDWTLADRRLSLVWRESNGPAVKPPSHNGFGTKLFQGALQQFDGTVEADFAPTGLLCKLSVPIPERERDALATVPNREVISGD